MLKPLGFYVLIEPQKVEEKTAGGIYIPQETQEKQQHAMSRGEIIAVGPASNMADDCVGKTALFGRYAGVEVEEGGRTFRLIDAQDVRAVVT